MKSLQKEQNGTKILLMTPQSAGINVQSPQSESTPRRLTLRPNFPHQRLWTWRHKNRWLGYLQQKWFNTRLDQFSLQLNITKSFRIERLNEKILSFSQTLLCVLWYIKRLVALTLDVLHCLFWYIKDLLDTYSRNHQADLDVI